MATSTSIRGLKTAVKRAPLLRAHHAIRVTLIPEPKIPYRCQDSRYSVRFNPLYRFWYADVQIS